MDSVFNKQATDTQGDQKLIRKSSGSLYCIMIKTHTQQERKREAIFFEFLNLSSLFSLAHGNHCLLSNINDSAKIKRPKLTSQQLQQLLGQEKKKKRIKHMGLDTGFQQEQAKCSQN